MSDIKLDRRVRRTRQQLRDALIALISEKGFSAITVQDITDRADVNRVTFYFHYKDKEDLLFQILQDMYDELEAKTTSAKTLEEWSRLDALYTFQHMNQYADLYRALWSENGLLSFLGRLIDYMADSSLEADSSRLPEGVTPPYPLELVEHFYAGAFMGLARWWIKHGTDYTAEQMADIYSQLETHTGLWAVGLGDQESTQPEADHSDEDLAPE